MLRKQKKCIVAQHLSMRHCYPDQTSIDNIQHVATCLDMYEQGGQTITTFSTRQMLHVALRKVELV